ncbi:MAG: cyclic nucleotide-binding domain-containing protein [Rhodospirillaceae bacterium]
MNGVLGRHPLALTRAMLYQRVAAEIGGTRPLTREGKAKDRDMFVTLLRDLMELAGLEGGPEIAEAVTRRARIVLSTDAEDLSFDAAVARVMDLLPHRSVRMGYLLDLVVSPLGQDNQSAVFAMLGRLVQQLTSITAFLPRGTTPEMRDRVMASLKRRLTAEGLPSAWREGIAQALDGFARREPATEKPPPIQVTPYATDEETKRIVAMTPNQESFQAGDVLFEEGDAGEIAYLIKSGEVEILLRLGNEERILTRLGRGEIFGEMSLIDSQPRSATARVSADAELAVIGRDNIQKRLERLQGSDMVLRRLIDVFVTRIRGGARSY